MADIAEINIGTVADDGTGDTLRDAGQKINDNFSALNADKLEGPLTLADITDAGSMAAINTTALPSVEADYRGQGAETLTAAFAAVEGAGSLPVDDTTTLVRDPGDPTKLIRLDAGAILTETTRVIFMGDRDVDLASGGTFAEKAQGDLAATAVQPEEYVRLNRPNHRTIGSYAEHESLTAYLEGARVYVDDSGTRRIYEVAIGGGGTTGDGTPPSGTGTGQTDGTVTWDYLRDAIFVVDGNAPLDSDDAPLDTAVAAHLDPFDATMFYMKVTATEVGPVRLLLPTMWESGVAIPAGSFKISDDTGTLRVYQTPGGGTTGATPPAGTGGTIDDGGISDWVYLGLAADMRAEFQIEKATPSTDTVFIYGVDADTRGQISLTTNDRVFTVFWSPERNHKWEYGGGLVQNAAALFDWLDSSGELGALASQDTIDGSTQIDAGTISGAAIGDGQIGSEKLEDVLTGGSATNADITWNSKGQITAAANGSGGSAPTPAPVVLNDLVTQLVPATHGDHLNKLLLTPSASADDFVYWVADDIAAAARFRFRSRTSGRVFVHRPPSTLGYDNPSGTGFVVGEFVEDQSSGARGQIAADNGSTTLSLVMVTGTFGNNNQIVGDDSGQTADVDGTITDSTGTVNGGAFVAIGTVEHGSAGYTALIEVESNAGTAPVIAVEGETAEATTADADLNMDGHEIENAVLSGTTTLASALTAADQNISAARLIDTAEVAPAATVSGSVTRDFTAGQVQELTLSNDVTDLAISNPPASGNAGAITFVIHTATHDWAHPTGIKWPDDGDAPTMTADGTDIITYITRDAGTTWYGFVGGLDFA